MVYKVMVQYRDNADHIRIEHLLFVHREHAQNVVDWAEDRDIVVAGPHDASMEMICSSSTEAIAHILKSKRQMPRTFEQAFKMINGKLDRLISEVDRGGSDDLEECEGWGI